jgi:hypothetical protein
MKLPSRNKTKKKKENQTVALTPNLSIRLIVESTEPKYTKAPWTLNAVLLSTKTLFNNKNQLEPNKSSTFHSAQQVSWGRKVPKTKPNKMKENGKHEM